MFREILRSEPVDLRNVTKNIFAQFSSGLAFRRFSLLSNETRRDQAKSVSGTAQK